MSDRKYNALLAGIIILGICVLALFGVIVIKYLGTSTDAPKTSDVELLTEYHERWRGLPRHAEFYIVTDSETGVQYILAYGRMDNNVAVTPLLDSNGEVMIVHESQM